MLQINVSLKIQLTEIKPLPVAQSPQELALEAQSPHISQPKLTIKHYKVPFFFFFLFFSHELLCFAVEVQKHTWGKPSWNSPRPTTQTTGVIITGLNFLQRISFEC